MNEEFDLAIKESDPRKLPTTIATFKKYEVSFPILVQLSHLMIATGVAEGQAYTQLVMAIGERVRNYYKIPNKSSLVLNIGAFILNAYAINKLIIIKNVNEYSNNKPKTVYKVYAGPKRNDLRLLQKEFNEVHDPYKPLLEQAKDWEYGTTVNPLGEEIKIIKNAKIDILSKINNHNTPIVLNAINKKQHIAYYIKPEIYEVYKWALKTNQPVFEHNSVDTIEIDRKNAKKREAEHILESAEPYVGKKFYQQYKMDNRGRLYPLSAYLNELNSDNAKGMLSFYEGKPLGKTGRNDLFHHIANMYGEDKLPHNERVMFVNNNYSTFVSYGQDPYNNKGWMEAEEPFQFLSAVMELAKYNDHLNNGGSEEDFISHTICYRDGSNNGLQWLFSLSKDNEHAHLANVKPTLDGKPGDMYQYVAQAVLAEIHNKAQNISDESRNNYNIYFKTIERLRNRCRLAENNGDKRAEYKRKLIKWYQRGYKKELKTTDLLYWDQADKIGGFKKSTWRKVVKRNVMTYGYSATKQGMGEQIIQDTRDIDNKYLSNKQHSAARLLGEMVYNTIENQFPLVSSTMKLFKDNCGEYMRKNGSQYYHNTIISNFPFKQHYVKYKKVRVWVQRVYIQNDDKSYEFKSIQVNINTEKPEPNIAKAKAGISPNTIHNLDSLHLMLVINECSFDIVSAHDSYGAHAANVNEMQKVIREQFKRIIDEDPIQNILDQTGNLVPMIERGDLDSSEILNSEFAFS